MGARIYHYLKIVDFGGQKQFKQQHINLNKDYTAMSGSNLIINVIDLLDYKNSVKYLKSLEKRTKNFNNIYVATKMDLDNEEFDKNLPDLESFIKNPIIVSSKTGEGFDKLIEEFQKIVSSEGNYSPNDIDKKVYGIVEKYSADKSFNPKNIEILIKDINEEFALKKDNNSDLDIKFRGRGSKISIIGIGGSGKTALINRLITGEFKETEYTYGYNADINFILSYNPGFETIIVPNIKDGKIGNYKNILSSLSEDGSIKRYETIILPNFSTEDKKPSALPLIELKKTLEEEKTE